MEFHSWYAKSIKEAQERYKKEEEEENIPIYKRNPLRVKDGDEEDLLRLDDDGGWIGL